MAKFTHRDINIGDKLKLKHRNGEFVVIEMLDGYRGIQVHNPARNDDAMWIDVNNVKSICRRLA